MTIHLIDYLAYQLHCEISDLRSAPAYKLLHELKKIPVEACTLQEWTECARYLFQTGSDLKDAQVAKAFLLDHVKTLA